MIEGFQLSIRPALSGLSPINALPLHHIIGNLQIRLFFLDV
jgi:hypothetical protein